MTAFLFAAVNHRECEGMSKLSEMTTFQAVPRCPAADTHVGMSWRGCLSRERLCDSSGGQTGNHIRLFPRSPSLTSLVRPLWGKSILGNGHAGFAFVPKQTSFFLSYWKCPKRLTDLKGKQIMISHICATRTQSTCLLLKALALRSLASRWQQRAATPALTALI